MSYRYWEVDIEKDERECSHCDYTSYLVAVGGGWAWRLFKKRLKLDEDIKLYFEKKNAPY